MNKERKLVVDPLVRWFKSQPAHWAVTLPSHDTAETGWDIQARRQNLDLLVEAKYIDGPFIASISGLVTAPLVRRSQAFMKKKKSSWCAHVCWAIGCSYRSRNLHQILLDYFSRNPRFWRSYCRHFRMKYVFFVERENVFRVSFKKLLSISDEYGRRAAGLRLDERRALACKLFGRDS